MPIAAKLTVIALIFSFFSCKKSDSGNTTPAESYMSFSSGSTWQFKQTDNSTGTSTNYMLTSTNRDTSINSKTYHIFTNSNGNSSQYLGVSGNDYYEFRSLLNSLSGNMVELLYLKSAAATGFSWSQSQTLNVSGLSVPVTVTYKIAETGGTRTINGTNYTNVVKVTASISSALVPPTGLITDIQNYYAPRVGIIESNYKIDIDFSGIIQQIDTKTILLSSAIL